MIPKQIQVTPGQALPGVALIIEADGGHGGLCCVAIGIFERPPIAQICAGRQTACLPHIPRPTGGHPPGWLKQREGDAGNWKDVQFLHLILQGYSGDIGGSRHFDLETDGVRKLDLRLAEDDVESVDLNGLFWRGLLLTGCQDEGSKKKRRMRTDSFQFFMSTVSFP
ncbi:MAG: hypothetical protein A2Y72_01755 [Chloroflexi bacterium RBG_13_53_26]|nr:MAG: hypothetical protein A2Y72_01755 [Chloroflexi bacterium RBG_13_53_26]